MIRTKDKNYHQILVDGKTYSELHLKYGASRSFNEVITEILRHHESAVSIIADCEKCQGEVQGSDNKIMIITKWVGPGFWRRPHPMATT